MAKALQESYPFDTVTVTFEDGTFSEFNFNEENETQNIFYINSVTKTENSFSLSGVFGKAIDASKVFSVKFNGVELFTKQ